MSIDPRLMERRKVVAENKAQKNVGRLLKFLLLVFVAGSLAWLVFSPWLSVRQVTTTGIEHSAANSVLADAGVVAGTPMILVNAANVEQRLAADPWVAEANLDLHWPNEVSVEVVEREPTAWVHTSGGWTRRAVDGVALPSGSEPDTEMAWIEMPSIADGDAVESTDVLGALEFIRALPQDLRPGTVVTRSQGEVWATVQGHEVRLGRGVDMVEKALSLNALLETNIAEGSTLVLIAPTNPAVLPPGETPDAAEDGGSGEAEEEGETVSDEND